MKNSISLSIYALCMSAALCGCGQAQSGGTVRNQVMDPVTEIPEWLEVTCLLYTSPSPRDRV